MNNTVKRQAAKQQAKTTSNKPAVANVPPRQVKRAPAVPPAAQTTAKPPAAQQVAQPAAPVEQRPKQQLSQMMSTTALDGFSGFTEEVEGDDRPQSGSAIQGTLLKFTAEGDWVTGAGEPMSRERELIPIHIERRVQKWVNQRVEETIIVEPGQKFPNVKAMNDAAPRSEWREDLNGNLVGPWQMQYRVYLLDAKTLDKFTWPTATIGGGICCRELADKVAWMHKYKGPNVNAVVTLSDTFMNTRFGGRQRPHLQIVRWIGFDGGDALPAPKPAPTPLEGEKSETPPWNEVKEPTLAEEMGDAVPDFDDDVSNI